MGFEPTNGSLGSYCLTTWQHPHALGIIASPVGNVKEVCLAPLQGRVKALPALCTGDLEPSYLPQAVRHLLG